MVLTLSVIYPSPYDLSHLIQTWLHFHILEAEGTQLFSSVVFCTGLCWKPTSQEQTVMVIGLTGSHSIQRTKGLPLGDLANLCSRQERVSVELILLWRAVI